MTHSLTNVTIHFRSFNRGIKGEKATIKSRLPIHKLFIRSISTGKSTYPKAN